MKVGQRQRQILFTCKGHLDRCNGKERTLFAIWSAREEEILREIILLFNIAFRPDGASRCTYRIQKFSFQGTFRETLEANNSLYSDLHMYVRTYVSTLVRITLLRPLHDCFHPRGTLVSQCFAIVFHRNVISRRVEIENCALKLKCVYHGVVSNSS